MKDRVSPVLRNSNQKISKGLTMVRFCLILLASVYSLPSFCNIDSLILVTKTQKDTSAVLAGYELGVALVGTDIDSSYKFLIQAANLADDLDYTNGKIVTYRSIGGIAPRIGKYEEGLLWLDKGLRLIDSLNLPAKNQVDFLTNKGAAHYRTGLVGKAIETYIVAVEVCREYGLDQQRSRLLNNLGIFYRSLKRFEEALEIYEESYEIRLANKDSIGMANILFNMAASYAYTSDHENAISKVDQAERIYEKKGMAADVAHCMITKGMAYFNLGESARALEVLENSLSFPDEKLERPFDFDRYNVLAHLYYEKGEISKAQQYLSKAATDITSSDFAEQKMSFYEIEHKVYQSNGKYKRAYESLSKLEKLRAEITASEKRSFRQEMETKYLTSEKEYEIKLLNNKQELTKSKLDSARMRNMVLAIGMFIFTTLLVWLFRLYTTTKNQKEVISVASKEKDLLLKEIHHRVKNNLQVISSLLSLQSKYVEDENAVTALNEGQNRVESMALIHQNLYRADNISGVNMKTYIPLLADHIFNSYNIQGEEIKIDYEIDNITLDVATVIPIGLVLNELISNALKYAFPSSSNGLVTVSLKERAEGLLLIVADNGIGLNDKVSAGFGSKLVRSFARKLQGELTMNTDNGTSVEIAIKNYKVA